MKRVLYVNQYPEDATSYYRIHPLVYLQSKDISITKLFYGGNISWETFIGYDILFIERPSSHNDLNIIKLAKQCGLKIVTDWDDDCLHIDQFNPMWHHYEQCRATLMECIVLSDEVWVSTAGIKKSFKLLNDNIHVIPNCHNDHLHPIKNKKAFNLNTKKAIWRGGSSHEADVYEYADKLITNINNNADWQFQFIGFRFVYMEQKCGDNYLPVSLMPLMQYFNYIQSENPNIIFHPLSNNKFNESKSNIAIIEAAYSGAAFFGNTNLPEFNQIGVLPFNQLEYLMQQEDVLYKANETSWEHICDTLLLSNINKLRGERVLSL